MINPAKSTESDVFAVKRVTRYGAIRSQIIMRLCLRETPKKEVEKGEGLLRKKLKFFLLLMKKYLLPSNFPHYRKIMFIAWLQVVRRFVLKINYLYVFISAIDFLLLV